MKKQKPEGIVVSQSMIKDVKKYVLKKMCGLVLKAKYIDKTWPADADDSPAKKIGRYFEYILTGSIGRSGVAPLAEYKKGALTNYKRDPLRNRLTIDKMTKPYQLAHKNAVRVKEYFKLMKIKVLEVNVHIQKGLKEGTIDIIALHNGHRIVIDVKYSGLLFEKWDELGWMWTDEQKKFHGTQALQYHSLTGIPFYFLVVSSTNDEDIRFFDIEFDEFSIEQHEAEVEDTRKKMKFFIDFGFHPVPELVRCLKCPLRTNCKDRVDAPPVQKIRLASND
jgi:hypothetical protein